MCVCVLKSERVRRSSHHFVCTTHSPQLLLVRPLAAPPVNLNQPNIYEVALSKSEINSTFLLFQTLNCLKIIGQNIEICHPVFEVFALCPASLFKVLFI